MNTFYQLWRTKRPKDAIDIISLQRLNLNNPCNFEEQALSLVGADIYNKLIKGYTEKQWGMDAKDLPAFIIKRLPLRFTFDNNYFNDPYQGIPIEGYNEIFNKCFQNSNVTFYRNSLIRIIKIVIIKSEPKRQSFNNKRRQVFCIHPPLFFCISFN